MYIILGKKRESNSWAMWSRIATAYAFILAMTCVVVCIFLVRYFVSRKISYLNSHCSVETLCTDDTNPGLADSCHDYYVCTL